MKNKMEYRKIIEFGKSSYVVSLPKRWLNEQNLRKGDVIYIDCDGDKLALYPAEQNKTRKPAKITIDITGMTEREIRLHLISKYIRNFHEITLVSKDMKAKARNIRNMIHDMMALEVVEETASKIVTRNFLNMEEISPDDLLRKMDVITRGMLADSINSFKENKYENIAERDTDVNRLSFLLFRTLRYLQRTPASAKKKGLDHDTLLSMWAATMNIESIADQSKRLAKLMGRVKFRKEDQKQFVKLYSTIEKYYLDTMEAFYEKDSAKAFKLLPKKRELIKQCKDFYRQNWNYEWVPVMLEKIKAIIAGCTSLQTYLCDMEQ